jgi:hypothetical protein
VLAQRAIPASKDARDARPMAANADIPFADESPIALLFAPCRRRSIAATTTTRAIERPALDDVRLADVECRPDNTAMAIITGSLVLPVEVSPAGIVVTARRSRGRGSSWE